MFSRIVALLPFALLVAAGHQKARQSGQCNTGPIQCCDSVGPASNFPNAVKQYGLDVLDDTMMGVSCSGVASSADCQEQPICCNDNSFNGLVVVGCSPINLNL